MADAIVGALRVVLSADTATFESALEGSARSLEKWGKNLGVVAAAAAAAFIAAGTAIALSLKHTIDDIETLANTSEKIGVPVEQLSELQFAAKLANVSVDTLAGGMVKLSKNMVEAAGDAESKAGRAFAALGVEVKNTDGTLKTSSQILGEVSEKFVTYEDSAEKTALAVALFGKSGAEMIPILNMGKTALDAAAVEANKFGLVLGTDAVQAAKAFNDNMDRLAAIQQGIWIQITSQALPALEKFSDALVELASNTQVSETAITAINFVIREVSIFVVEASAAFGELVRTVQLVIETFAAAKNFSLDEIKAAWDRYTAANAAADAATRATIATLKEEETELNAVITAWKGLEAAQSNQAKVTAPLLQAATTATKNSLDSFIESTQKSIAAQNAEILAYGQGIGVRERLRVVMQAEELARQNNITLTNAQRMAIEALGAQAEITAQKLHAKQMIEQSLPLWDAYQKKLEDNRVSLIALGATHEEIEKVQRKTAEMMGLTWEQQTLRTSEGWEKAFAMFGKQNKEMAFAAKAIAIGMATINTYQAATKALAELGPIFGPIAAAGVIALGLAQVAQIASIGFAQGGSFKVGGGLTGIDSQMVAFKATPGEMVDIRRPGQGGGVPATINLVFPNPNEFFAVHIREMVDALNRAVTDGYVLKVAR